MSDAKLTATATEVEPGVGMVDLVGDVTPAVEDALMAAYRDVEDARSVILNFEGLEYMNSGGIGLLVTLLVRSQRSGQRLLAYGLSDHYRQIFELTRLDDAIELHDSRTDALAEGAAV